MTSDKEKEKSEKPVKKDNLDDDYFIKIPSKVDLAPADFIASVYAGLGFYVVAEGNMIFNSYFNGSNKKQKTTCENYFNKYSINIVPPDFTPEELDDEFKKKDLYKNNKHFSSGYIDCSIHNRNNLFESKLFEAVNIILNAKFRLEELIFNRSQNIKNKFPNKKNGEAYFSFNTFNFRSKEYYDNHSVVYGHMHFDIDVTYFSLNQSSSDVKEIVDELFSKNKNFEN